MEAGRGQSRLRTNVLLPFLRFLLLSVGKCTAAGARNKRSSSALSTIFAFLVSSGCPGLICFVSYIHVRLSSRLLCFIIAIVYLFCLTTPVLSWLFWFWSVSVHLSSANSILLFGVSLLGLGRWFGEGSSGPIRVVLLDQQGQHSVCMMDDRRLHSY
jgi:hypothetical protein